MFVPVIDKNNQPLMPTSPKRARELLKKGRAIKRWFKGIFAIKLIDREGGQTQAIAVGVDPGSKKEAFTVKTESKTLLNVQADAVTWVKSAVETRRNLRRSRRQRKTPCRANRQNRKRGGIPPSTRARWGWKLRLLNWLKKIFPITTVVIEDVQAQTKPNKRRWNLSFSPLQVGKMWFYDQVRKIVPRLEIRQGHQTKVLRDNLQLHKLKDKMSSDFHAHCVDSWVLANDVCGQQPQPDNKHILYVTPLQFHRRQLHVQNPAKGGVRKLYGGTRSLGFKRGSIVQHPKHGLTYVGGTSKGKISLHSIQTGKRLCQTAQCVDITFLAYNSWRSYAIPPSPKGKGILAEV